MPSDDGSSPASGHTSGVKRGSGSPSRFLMLSRSCVFAGEIRVTGTPSCVEAIVSVQQYVSSTSAYHSACVTVSAQQTIP